MYYLVNVAYLIWKVIEWCPDVIILNIVLQSEEWPHLCLVFENNFPLPITNSII